MTLTDALGWTLLHTIWEGSAVALVLAVALCFLRAPQSRYVAACGGLAVTLAGFAITLARLMPADPFAQRVAPVLRGVPAGAGTGAFAFASAHSNGVALPPWIVMVWLAGMVLFQIRALGGWFAVWRLRRTGVCAAAGAWQKRLTELAEGLRVLRPVVLLESSLAEVPVVIGHLKPVILMPAGLLTGLPYGQIESILLHELAHVLRNDYLVNLLQTVVEGLLFYHPAVWWISSVIRAERENCCDDLAVAASGDPRQFAIALAALAHGRSSVAMAANGGSVVRRVRRLLKQPEGPRAGLAPVFAACLIVVACTVGLTQARAGAQESAKPVATPYTKWLNEDVAYIIQDEERRAFKRLTTDEEREMFITQFWLRRDPTPDTVENEFKEEHYRRIAWANSRFGTPSGLPGWKTDRGRISITYGPPDEIESHPSPINERGFPFEQWKYRLIEGVGQNVIIDFEDKDRTGEYRMTMDPAPPK